MSVPFRDVKLVLYRYYGQFFKRRGRGWSSRPFYDCGNAGVSIELADALKQLGHRVVIVEIDEGDDL